MRIPLLTFPAILALAATAGGSSWFSGGGDSNSGAREPAYSTWSSEELKQWLELHSIPVPSPHPATESELRDRVAENWHSVSAWTYDQYIEAQKTFADMRDTAFEHWDESQLREFLLRQGIVAPRGPKEHLVLLAKSHYKGYTNAAKSLTDRASATAAQASKTASKTVEGVMSSASSAVVQAETEVSRTLDRSKDYVYSTWSDNKLREYLETQGLIKTKTQKKRDELLAIMEKHYHKVVDPIWETWGESYMHEWLVSHHVIKSDYEKNRDKLRDLLQRYYYDPRDRIWSTWSDVELRKWLYDNGVIASKEVQISRDKMLKMVEEKYYQSVGTFWSAWSDNQIRDWLINHGYLRSDAQAERDQLIKLANEKYNDSTAKTAAYLAWPDARLRAYLREHGLDDSNLPGGRPGLLQETRIRWVQSQNKAEAVIVKIREIVNGGVGRAEDVLYRIMRVVSSGWTESKEKASSEL